MGLMQKQLTKTLLHWEEEPTLREEVRDVVEESIVVLSHVTGPTEGNRRVLLCVEEPDFSSMKAFSLEANTDDGPVVTNKLSGETAVVVRRQRLPVPQLPDRPILSWGRSLTTRSR